MRDGREAVAGFQRDRQMFATSHDADGIDLSKLDRPPAGRILIVEDGFTEGFTIREIARALIHANAVEVSEIVLAREPWKPE